MKRETSRRLFEEAQRLLPGGVDSPVRAFRAVGGSPSPWPGGRAMLEALVGIKRAGADLILTYFAKDVAALLRERR